MRGPVFFSFLALAVLVGAFLPRPENAEKEAILMQTMLEGLRQLHYDPQDLDDDFSKKLHALYIDRIDGTRRWLTQEDVQKLEPYKLQIDDEAQAGSFAFFDASLKVLEGGVKKAEGFYQDILSKPFDFSGTEEIELDGEKRSFAKNDAQLQDYWKQSLKYEVLTRLADKIESQEEKAEEEGEAKKTIKELEKEAREEVQENYEDLFERIAKLRRSDRLSNYLNAFTNLYDPHTGYFEPKDKENFDIGMSGTLEGIGARLQTEGDWTKVISIVPGGPAWKQKDLEPNDLIMKVAQGDEEPTNVEGFRIDDVVKLIRGKKGTEVRLTVKRVDGSTDIVPITRDVVILDEGYAKSVILDIPGKVENIGYIKLPRFYADFNRREGRSCADDIEKELAKLKANNVNGIILDLRNNGGGSLRDVVEMSGLFIEEGPIVQVKTRGRTPEVLPDENPLVQYDGPLVVMVNQFSASASEILAAALQDYDRALIVGSKSTFGKGTVQRFFDLDRAIRGYNEVKPLGEVKLTIQKFYRVNGGSTQLKGVIPDIVLPDRYHYIEVGEKDNEYAMEWSEIPAVAYEQKVTRIDNKEALKAASEARLKNHKSFQLVLESAKYLKEQREDTRSTLNLEAYLQESEEMEAVAKKYEDMFPDIEGLKITNLPVDLNYINEDESREARNKEWVEGIQKDIYIEEVLAIMHDMANSN